MGTPPPIMSPHLSHCPSQGEPGLEGDSGPAGPDGLKVSVLLVQRLGEREYSGAAFCLWPHYPPIQYPGIPPEALSSHKL